MDVVDLKSKRDMADLNKTVILSNKKFIVWRDGGKTVLLGSECSGLQGRFLN